MKKKILSLVIMLGLLTSCLAGMGQNVNAKGTVISEKQAKIMAILQIQTVIFSNEKDEVSKWQWGVSIEEPVPMYSLEGEIEAYYVAVVGKENEPAGYVIVGANRTHSPIIEYATAYDFYPAVVLSEKNGDNLYYMGGLSYIVGVGKELIDVSNFGEQKELEPTKRRSLKVFKEEFTEDWEYWYKLLNSKDAKIVTNSVNKVTNGYRAGRSVSVDVTSYNLNYQTMNSYLGYQNHCAPLAGTNLMIYWYRRNSYEYAELKIPNDPNWRVTFERLYRGMGTVSNGTNFGDNVPRGLKSYVEGVGLLAETCFIRDPQWQDSKIEIDENRPYLVGYCFSSDGSQHTMLVLGYSCTRNGSNDTNKKIRVADGYRGDPVRHITFSESTVHQMGTLEISRH